ncbi:MAG: hypothetical protein ACFB51_00410 [Anaerolineae bacterium]
MADLATLLEAASRALRKGRPNDPAVHEALAAVNRLAGTIPTIRVGDITG